MTLTSGKCCIFFNDRAGFFNHRCLESYYRQFYCERFKIILYDDVSFRQQFVAVIQIAQAYFGAWLGAIPAVEVVLHDDVVGVNGDVDG